MYECYEYIFQLAVQMKSLGLDNELTKKIIVPDPDLK